MSTQKLYAIAGIAVFLLGFAAGCIVFKGCFVKPCPEPKAVETRFVVPDSAKAAIYADGYDDGKNSAVPRVITVRGKDSLIYDPHLVRIAEDAYRQIDSLIAENFRLAGEKDELQDIVAHEISENDDYRLEQFYRLRERSFRGSSLTFKRTPVVTQRIPFEHTFWTRWGYGPQLGVGIGAQVEQRSQGGTELKYRPTGYLGFGVHYDLSK